MKTLPNLVDILQISLNKKNIDFLIDKSKFIENNNWAHLSGDIRSSDVSRSIDGSTIVMTFWDKGHSVGNISTTNMDTFIDICYSWFILNIRLDEIRKIHSEIEIDPIEPLLYGPIEILRKYIWSTLEQYLSQESNILYLTYKLLVFAKHSTNLSVLFPFTSHSHLHFSDSSSVPNNWLLPHLEPISINQVYLVDGTKKIEYKDFKQSVFDLDSIISRQYLNIRIGI